MVCCCFVMLKGVSQCAVIWMFEMLSSVLQRCTCCDMIVMCCVFSLMLLGVLFYCAVMPCHVLHCGVLSVYVVLWRAVRYRAILCCIVLYLLFCGALMRSCALEYCVAWTILCCSHSLMLCSVMLGCDVLCYVVLCHFALWPAPLHCLSLPQLNCNATPSVAFYH